MQELCTTPLSVGKLQKYGAKPFLGLMPCSSCSPPPQRPENKCLGKTRVLFCQGGRRVEQKSPNPSYIMGSCKGGEIIIKTN